MSFAIVAEFPLGTYRGHLPDGRPDPLPSPARLHAALLAAAGQGVRADAAEGALAPSPADRAALAWLEEHAPDAIAAPTAVTNDGLAVAYRPEGFFGVRERRRVPVSREDALGSVALAAPVAWLWDDPPPSGVAAALEALCREVSHLGTAESPAVLRVGEALATHRLDRAAGLLSGGGLDVEVARPGRTATLERVHAEAVGRPPFGSADRARRAEEAVIAPPSRTALALARYAPLEAPAPEAPWPTAVLLPIDEHLPPDARVAWSVALHRALVGLIGDGAPPLVTGRYDAGVSRPANRLAIQFIPASTPSAPSIGAAGAFALLIPGDADPGDLATLGRAVGGLRELRLGARRTIRMQHPVQVLAGDSFWSPVADGSTRVWVSGAAIPESRPVRGQLWTLGDAALLSVGLVLRDRFDRPADRAAWYRGLVAGVAAAGGVVLEAHKLNGGDSHRYVHHVTPETAVQPYRAALRLVPLVGDRTVMAIGQSRHLGGGLLLPLDLPVGQGSTGDWGRTA